MYSLLWLKVCFLLVGTALCSEQKTVVLVSFDGFRWDYLYQGYSPDLERISLTGVRIEQIKNVFPTKTFPNHYSLVTGLYPESHGIIANHMYDPGLEKHFKVGDVDPEMWNEAEPIWVTLRRRGHVTAAVNWPGSDVEIRGVRPSYFAPYNGSMPFKSRVDKAMSWLQLKPSHRPSFIALYFEEPDFSAHGFGPDSDETTKAVERVDAIAAYLMERLRDIGQADSVNVIFTSDHGMVELSDSGQIYLRDYVEDDTYELIDYSPLAAILPHEGMAEEVYSRLHGAHPNLTVFHRQDVPKRFHYRHNSRIMPILALADLGWSINRQRPGHPDRGGHGYDNKLAAMHPFFIATGPAFKVNFKLPLMSILDVYPLIFNILGEEPLACNGTLSQARKLLRRRSVTVPSRPESSGTAANSAPAGAESGRQQHATAFLLGFGGVALVVGTLLLAVVR